MDDLRCKNCNSFMEEVDRYEGGNYRDQVMFWCPECGTLCGPFDAKWGPSDFNWRDPKMTSFPEVKTAIELMKDRDKG